MCFLDIEDIDLLMEEQLEVDMYDSVQELIDDEYEGGLPEYQENR